MIRLKPLLGCENAAGACHRIVPFGRQWSPNRAAWANVNIFEESWWQLRGPELFHALRVQYLI